VDDRKERVTATSRRERRGKTLKRRATSRISIKGGETWGKNTRLVKDPLLGGGQSSSEGTAGDVFVESSRAGRMGGKEEGPSAKGRGERESNPAHAYNWGKESWDPPEKNLFLCPYKSRTEGNWRKKGKGKGWPGSSILEKKLKKGGKEPSGHGGGDQRQVQVGGSRKLTFDPRFSPNLSTGGGSWKGDIFQVQIRNAPSKKRGVQRKKGSMKNRLSRLKQKKKRGCFEGRPKSPRAKASATLGTCDQAGKVLGEDDSHK